MGQRIRWTTGRTDTDGQRTDDDDGTDSGTDERTEDEYGDDVADTTGRTDRERTTTGRTTNILMSKCADHEATFRDTHIKLRPDSVIYASKAIILGRLQL